MTISTVPTRFFRSVKALPLPLVALGVALVSSTAFGQDEKAKLPAEKRTKPALPLITGTKKPAPSTLELSLGGGVQTISSKGLLFNPSDQAQAIGSLSDINLKLYPFSRLGKSPVYSMLGFSGRFLMGQTNAADIKDASVGEKVGSYKLKQQEMQAGIVVRLPLLDNKFTPRLELSPLFRMKQNPEISGPLSKAAVVNFDARGFGSSLGLQYRPKGSFEFDLNALFAGSMQGHSTNMSVDEVTSTSVNLQKASLFRISERTSYVFKNFFSCLDVSFSAFEVTIPQDDIPSRTITQRTTAASVSVGAFL